MRIHCDRATVADALAAVSRAASSFGPINVLTGVRFEALTDRVVLSATDTELSLRVAVPATVCEDGVGVIPARTLVELVRKLPDGLLSIETDEQAVRVVTDDAEYRLNALPAADFPEVPSPPSPSPIRVERASLVDSFARVGRVAARDMSRPVYTGVLVGIETGTLTMVATDGYRLAVVTREASASGDLAPTLVPARALSELARLPADDGWLELVVADNVIAVKAGDYRLTARRLNGELQPWERLVRAEFAHEAVVERGRLLAALERAAVVVRRGTPVVLDFQETHLFVRVSSPEVGQASERVAVRAPAPSITVAFNPGYLIEGLQMLQDDEVGIRMSDALRPVVLSSERSDTTYLVAPVRSPGG